jgi:hypothetical protein
MINIIERITKKILGDRRFESDRRKLTKYATGYLKPERRSEERRKGIN